jgi:fumarate hydratase class II
MTGYPFVPVQNKYAAIAAHEAMVSMHGALKTLATALLKISNDIRWLASGPRAGLGEIELPANEPGSSIMPGKVNPTQCEAVSMLCCQVLGNDVAIGVGGSLGNFELNAYKPLILHNGLQSIRLLGDGMNSFREHCVEGISVRESQIKALLNQSLMIATALSPHIGYEKAAQIAKLAHRENSSVREAAIKTQWVTGEQFDQWVKIEEMVPTGDGHE